MPHDAPPEGWLERYSAAVVATIRLTIADRPGELGALLDLIGETKAPLGDISVVAVGSTTKVRDIQVYCLDHDHLDLVIAKVKSHEHVRIEHVVDDVLEIHRGGTIETVERVELNSVTDLRMVYTPGVASVCQLIEREPEAAWEYTHKGNRVAIVTDGTAVLGLGDIGPLAALPVMEGKAAIFARFVGISADPILIGSKDPKKIIETVKLIHQNYAAIQLEDIGAPACFEVEETLSKELDIPVFHDDQHGTATVVLAGLINALRATNREPGDCRAVVLGAGAAGLRIARFLVDFGLQDVILCDSRGALYEGRPEGMNPWKDEVALVTNKGKEKGSLADVMKGRDLFVGVSRPGLVTPEMVSSMAKDSIVFALANPVSEIPVREAKLAGAKVALDGRGMNNALAYPGIFRGALDVRASDITMDMKIAAARALADAAQSGELMPEMLDEGVHEAVAEAVRAAAST